MLKQTVIAAATFIAGCAGISPGFTYTVVIDPAFSERDVACITDAVRAWEDVTGGKLHVKSITVGACSTSDVDNEVCFHVSTEAAVAAASGGGTDIAAFTHRAGSTDSSDVYFSGDFDRYYSDALTTQVFAHELGHTLGLEHTQDGTLMCWETQCAPSLPTCDDVAQWASVRGVAAESTQCPRGGTFTLTGL